jgi:hypothetical protein
MKSLQIVLIALVALVVAVASKRGLFARVGLAAVLAVSLLWIAGHGAQADSFKPSVTVSLSNPVADSPTDVTAKVHIPSGDVYTSFGITFDSTAFQVTPSDELKLGVRGGIFDAVVQVGFMNGPCNTPLPLHFDMLNASTDKSRTVTYEDAFKDSNGDGNPDFIDMYPDFNDRILGPAQPYWREAGIADVAGTKLLLQWLMYEPGATLYGRTLDPALGEPGVAVVNNTGDPQAVPAPGAGTDTCSPCDTTELYFGTAPDGTVMIKNPKEPGTYTRNVLYIGQRDADGDGIENNLDPCPLDPDPTWDPRAASAVGPGDADGDGLPSSCDPDDNDANNDEDGDGYLNRGDNCPLLANGVNDADNQGDSDFDGIGDACDPNPDNADSEGEAPEAVLSADVTITEAAATPTPVVETPTPTVAPPATPAATPRPAVTPVLAPTPVIAPPVTGAGSASGTSWPWWPFVAAVAGAAAAAAGVLLAWQAMAGARR